MGGDHKEADPESILFHSLLQSPNPVFLNAGHTQNQSGSFFYNLYYIYIFIQSFILVHVCM